MKGSVSSINNNIENIINKLNHTNNMQGGSSQIDEEMVDL